MDKTKTWHLLYHLNDRQHLQDALNQCVNFRTGAQARVWCDADGWYAHVTYTGWEKNEQTTPA